MTRTQVKVLPGAVVESNLFLDFNYSSFHVDTQASGYWRNNRVIFLRTQSNRQPDITLKGDAARSSYGGGANLLNQGGVGFDAEAWGNSSRANCSVLRSPADANMERNGPNGGTFRSFSGLHHRSLVLDSTQRRTEKRVP